MKVKVYPSTIDTNPFINLPPSKSIAHRAIICASLANGTSKLTPIEYSKDILATINGAKELGSTITTLDDTLLIQGNGFIKNTTHEIYCNESASTLRFFIPLFALLNQNSVFIGKKSLLSRPLQIYQDLFQKMNLMFVTHPDYISIHGPLKGGEFSIRGNVSSQFISGLFFALPLCQENSIIEVTEKIESYPYILLTIHILQQFHIHIEKRGKNKFFIAGNQKYLPKDFTIEGDFSQLSYLALLGILNQPITFTNVPFHSFQGDKIILKILKDLNVKMIEKASQLTIFPSMISSYTFDISDYPDLALSLCVLGMFCQGTFILKNVHRLAYKESNRIQSIIEEMIKLGVDISMLDDTLIIHGASNEHFCHQNLFSHHDHRILMALFMCCVNCQNPIVIEGAECINKSYPSFYQTMKKIGVRFEILKS